MSWIATGTTLVGAAGSYLSNKSASKAAEQAAAEGQTTETSQQATLPEWAEPYVTGSRIREWDMPVMSQEYMAWADRMGEGQFANQDPVNEILSFDQLTGGGAAGGSPEMANLLGIGSQYSQLPPEMFQQRAAGQGGGGGGGEMSMDQLEQMMRRMELEDTWGSVNRDYQRGVGEYRDTQRIADARKAMTQHGGQKGPQSTFGYRLGGGQ